MTPDVPPDRGHASGRVFGGVEAGGTKVVCVIGRGPDTVIDATRIPTTTPDETLARAVRFFRDAVENGVEPGAIGIGSFGPIDLDPASPTFGRIASTPKPGWAGTDMLAPFRALGIPVTIDTDVNAAALAEGRWGAARDVASFVYLTLGTGIGGGAVVDGRPLHGLGHPEMGHIAVARRADDGFPGACPFHGDCLEGMASGTAIRARLGRPAEALEGAQRDETVRLVAAYLADGIRTIVSVLSPARVILGGGLASMPGLVEAVASGVASRLAAYPGVADHARRGFVVGAALGERAGSAGALLLAERAIDDAGGAAWEARRPARDPGTDPATG